MKTTHRLIRLGPDGSGGTSFANAGGPPQAGQVLFFDAGSLAGSSNVATL